MSPTDPERRTSGRVGRLRALVADRAGATERFLEHVPDAIRDLAAGPIAGKAAVVIRSA
jgi:hypothetical protein